VGTRCADHVTPLYPQKLALTSPTGGGRSVGIVRVRTKATEFSLVLQKLTWKLWPILVPKVLFFFFNFTFSVLEVEKVLHIIYFKYDTQPAEPHRVQNMFANFQHTNSKCFCFWETQYSHSDKHWLPRPRPRGVAIRGRVVPNTWISTSERGQYWQHYLSMYIILINTVLPHTHTLQTQLETQH